MLQLSPMGLLGASLLAGVPSIGRIRNFRAASSAEPFAADLSFDLQDVDEDTVNPALYLEGQLTRMVPVGLTRATLSGIFAGPVRLEAQLVGEASVAPDMIGHFGADSAYITWPWIADADLSSVEVYRAASISGGKLVSPVLVGTVSRKQTQARLFALPDSGATNGRISTWGGVPTDFTGNGAFTITIASEGTADWTGFGKSGTVEFERGDVIQLPFGLYVRFEDLPADYVTADEYTVHMGLPTFYQTPTLAEGTYYFGIRAVDTADNATPQDTDDIDAITGAVRIVYEPGAVTGQAIAYTVADDGSVTVTWTDPGDADLDAVRVYSNFNPVTNELEDYVIEDAPIDEVSAGIEAWGLAGVDLLTGTLMVYLRPVDTDGFENESIDMLTLNLPPTAAEIGLVLGDVLLLGAEPAVGGSIHATWAYLFRENDAYAGFAYWLGTSIPDFTTEPDGVLTPSSATYPTAAYDVLFSSVGSHGDTYYLAVRATDGDGNYGNNTNYVTVVLDAEGPVVTGPVLGVTN